MTEAATPVTPDAYPLEPLDRTRFRSSRHVGSSSGRIYGGHLAAQAIRAMGRTVEHAMGLHSFHGYFLAPGDVAHPMDLEVECVRDGRTYASRMVRVLQNGRETFRVMGSYKRQETGIEDRRVPAPIDPVPPASPPVGEPASALDAVHRPLENLELRYASIDASDTAHRSRFWLRTVRPLGDDPREHEAGLTYLSDLGLTAVAALSWETMPGANPRPSRLVRASLDHAMWVHRRDFRADEWLLFDLRSPTAADGRGHASAHVFTGDGVFVASLVQESLQRFPVLS